LFGPAPLIDGATEVELMRGRRHFFHGLIESSFVGARWSGRATQLSHELEGRRLDLVVGRGRLEIG
jgi:hypothetical protein